VGEFRTTLPIFAFLNFQEHKVKAFINRIKVLLKNCLKPIIGNVFTKKLLNTLQYSGVFIHRIV